MQLPKDEGFETVAGFILAQLQRLPKKGDVVEFEGRRFVVEEMDGMRVSKVKVESVPKLVNG